MAANNSIDLIVNQKASFRAVFNVKNADGTPVNLGGYTVAAYLTLALRPKRRLSL